MLKIRSLAAAAGRLGASWARGGPACASGSGLPPPALPPFGSRGIIVECGGPDVAVALSTLDQKMRSEGIAKEAKARGGRTF